MLGNGTNTFIHATVSGLRPDPELWVDEWSVQHAYIPPEGNAEPGRYSIERTPFAREVMRVLSPADPCNRVVVMGASQMLKTQTAMNWMMAIVDSAPGNILALMPTGDLATRLSSRINKTIKATAKVERLFAKARTREGKNTDSTKEFRGGTLHIATSGSAANLAEIPARYGYGDEIDDWESNLQGQGDPIVIFENRGSTYGRNRKWYYSSSPKLPSEISRIYKLFMQGDQRYLYVPCPHCGVFHILKIENLRVNDEFTAAYMECPECHELIDEYSKTQMLASAKWIAHGASKDGTVSFTISQLYAPLGWTSWLELARMRDDAEMKLEQGDHEAIKAFYNTRLALCYDENKSVTTVDELMLRAENYPPRVVPDAALVLTMGVDTQDNRLELQIDAWGPGMERWVIDYQVLEGDPSAEPSDKTSVWARLDEIRRTPLMHASGVPILISAWGIDSGGSHTQDVYNFASSLEKSNCVILKGASKPNRPIISSKGSPVDINWNGTVRKEGATLWSVGTGIAKDYIFNRIEITSGPGAFHFHNQLPKEWFEQLLAERKVQYVTGGFVSHRWEKPSHARNEALDCTVYSLAVAIKLRIDKWSAMDWKNLREKLIPKTINQDLFTNIDYASEAKNITSEEKVIVDKAIKEVLSELQNTVVIENFKEQAANLQAMQQEKSKPRLGRRILSRGI